jgi:hypothetical protein
MIKVNGEGVVKSIEQVAFKAIRENRRAQLWSRQASIIMDLTTLAFRQVARKQHSQRY